jgi:hypothetical protein
MRTFSLSTGAILLGSLLVPAAFAQETNQADLRQPSAVRQTAFEYDNYLYFAPDQGKAGAADTKAPPSPNATAAPADVKKDEGKKEEEKKDEPAAEAPKDEGWKLPQPCCLKEHGWTVGGWLEAGMTFNGAYPSDGYNSPVGFNDLNQQPQVDQIYLSINKAVDTKGCGIDYGGSLDLMYGTDSRFVQASGLEVPGNPTFTPPAGGTLPANFAYDYSPYRFAIPQAYFDVGINNLTIRTGHMVTNLGAETINPTTNFFYSHSYTFLYGIPFTHTGMMFTYKCNDQLTVMSGIQTGNNRFDYSPFDLYPGTNVPGAVPGGYEHMGYLGGVTWTGPCKKLNVNFQISITDDTVNATTGLDNSEVNFTLITTYNVTDKLTYTNEWTYGNFSDPVLGASTWYGFNQYLKYQLNDKWSAGLRAEWFRDNNGEVVTNSEPFSANSMANGFTPVFFAGNFYEVTAGLNWKPNANFTLRPEVRWDWSDAGATVPVVGAAPKTILPFNGGTTGDQFLFAVDAIFTY